jgi:O-antigen/teichoic acid export membrane protein
LVLARLAAALITFTIPLVLARKFSLADYGTYKQLFLLSQTLSYILPLGMAQSLYFFVPRADEKRPYFGQTLLFLGVMGAVACAALWAFAGSVSQVFDNPVLGEHMFELGLYTGLLMAAWPLEIGLTSQGKTRISAICYLASDGVRAVIMIAPVIWGLGLHGMMMGLVGYAAVRAVLAWAILPRQGTGALWDRRLFMSQLAYAAPYGAAVALSVPQQYLHQFAVSGAFSPELFALYAVGCFQLPLVDLLYTPTSEVLMVRLGELERTGRVQEAVDAFREVVQKLAFIFLPAAAFMWVAAPEFIGALFGTKFLGAVPMFRVSVISVVLAILPLDAVLRGRNQTGHIFRTYLVKAILTLPLVFFGIQAFGMMGAILAWAAAELVGKAMLLWRAPKALAVDYGIWRLLPWKALRQAAVAAVLAGLSVMGVRQLLPDLIASVPHGFAWRLLPLAIAGALFTVGYFSVLWCTGVQPTRVLFALRRRGATV